ncbi:hypothetical protein CBD81_001785 [bacterium TMED221]|nr:MAG: hypothetical protein CBD81_001785 [bacterium TMED221]|tara:strand:+ start:357 stop:899 length:543 start_codon:yes stop_codon:yes gene_type:complete
MKYQNQKISNLNLGFDIKNFYSILGLYIFSLGSLIGGFSIYLLLESVGRVDPKLITWNGQGLFWFLILFLGAIFLLFIPIEFINTFKLYNSTFKDLVTNILYVILFSLISLIFFQIILGSDTQIVRDIQAITRAVSFSGFIAVPIILFLQHSLRNNLTLTDRSSYGITLFSWIASSQIFL